MTSRLENDCSNPLWPIDFAKSFFRLCKNKKPNGLGAIASVVSEWQLIRSYQDFALYFDCTIIVTSQMFIVLYFYKQCKFLNSIVSEIMFIDKDVIL